jgi:hypothetical protein
MTFAQDKKWVQVEFTNIEFDTLFFEVELEKTDYFSVYKYYVLQNQLHGIFYICIFYIDFEILKF